MGYTYKYAIGLKGTSSGHLSKIELIRNYFPAPIAPARAMTEPNIVLTSGEPGAVTPPF